MTAVHNVGHAREIFRNDCSAQRETLQVLLLIERGTTSHIFLFHLTEVTFS
jgi:hypothetical protein